eukprot:14864933-Alexandrium_andersonii.AAC.1
MINTPFRVRGRREQGSRMVSCEGSCGGPHQGLHTGLYGVRVSLSLGRASTSGGIGAGVDVR